MRPLTSKEVEVLQFIADGKRCSEISAILGRSKYTVSVHLRNLHVKLDTHSAAQAVAEGFRKGILK
jgi:DNA-binding CsgD family transcriptional regulator